MDNGVGFVINYYCRPSYLTSRRTSAELSILTLKENLGVSTIVVVDGSPVPDPEIEIFCRKNGVKYLYPGGDLTFAQGFNVGWKSLDEDYIGLMASDIFVPQGTIEKLFGWVKKPDIGCVFPYLSFSDYKAQMPSFVRQPITCEPTAMTLNLNIFKRDVLSQAGGVDEGFLGCYNDIILLVKIREMGYRAVLVGDTFVTHLGKMTISQGSNYNKDVDRKNFEIQYPHLSAKYGKFGIRHWRQPQKSPGYGGWVKIFLAQLLEGFCCL
jgi:GT2 family glycosyltransferase